MRTDLRDHDFLELHRRLLLEQSGAINLLAHTTFGHGWYPMCNGWVFPNDKHAIGNRECCHRRPCMVKPAVT